LFDDEDDLGNFVEDPKIRRPLGTKNPEMSFGYILGLDSVVYIEDVSFLNKHV